MGTACNGHAIPAGPASPAQLELRSLSFAYPGGREPALDGVDLVAAPGQRVALVGEVASGKSTVLSIIPRLLEPPRGTVLLDGRDVLDVPLLELRGRVALVPQGSFLFSATLRDNIALARPDADPDEVLAAVLARPASATTSSDSRPASTPWSASAASRFPAASGSASRSRVP